MQEFHRSVPHSECQPAVLGDFCQEMLSTVGAAWRACQAAGQNQEYTSHWLAPDGCWQQVATRLLFRFVGESIDQIGVQAILALLQPPEDLQPVWGLGVCRPMWRIDRLCGVQDGFEFPQGLGLCPANEIASVQGQGTAFTIALPLLDDEAESMQSLSATRPSPAE